MPKLPLWATYAGVFAVIITIVAIGYRASQVTTTPAVVNATQTPEAVPTPADNPSVDKFIATDVALHLAEQTNMPVTAHLAEYSATIAIESKLAQNDDTAIVKPQIIQPTAATRDVIVYIVKKGDTLDSIAAVYGISVQTIKWANDLTSNSVSVGRKLKIPPVDGVIYKVKSGDSIDKLASTYKTNKDRIVSFNNLEISGLKPGTTIIIPGGILPASQRPGYTEPAAIQSFTFVNYGSGFGGSSWRIKVGSSGYPGNGYAYGNCTYYAFDRRHELGLKVGANWGNATSWAWYAASEGYVVNNMPSVGAIIQNSGGFGHVGIVEKVRKDGSIVISEMNAYVSGGGWNVVNGRIIPKSQVGSYAYIH